MLSNVTVALAAVHLLVSSPSEMDLPSGTATIHVDELLRLHRLEQKVQPPKKAPPLPYALDEILVDGRIVGDAVEGTLSVQVSTMSQAWVRVPIMRIDPTLSVVRVEKIAGANLVVGDKSLDLVTQKKGVFRFELGFLKTADQKKGTYNLALHPMPATVRRFRVRYDAGLFSAVSTRGRQEGEDLVVYPEGGALRVSWTQKLPVAPQEKRSTPKPLIEPIVKHCQASWVVTLSGQRIGRYRCSLGFHGNEVIGVRIPEGQALKKAFLNGVPIQAKPNGRDLQLHVEPPRPGQQSAVVELVFVEHTVPLSLSGQLHFRFPALTWDTNELVASFWLPKVFNYTWAGGSLAPAVQKAAPKFTHQIPTPGKKHTARQQIVTGEADVRFRYTVDLAGHYHH